MTKFRRALVALVATEDAFGLAERKPVRPTGLLGRTTTNQRYAFLTDDKKLEQFDAWMDEQFAEGVLAPSGDGTGHWSDGYIESAYKKGVLRSYTDTHKSALADQAIAYEGGKAAFIRDAFGAPEKASKIKLLGSRSFEGMKGLSNQAKLQMNRILADGMAQGRGPREIGRQMAKEIGSLSKARAATIARTEMIHAHAEGQLDGFEQLGVDDLQIMAEWKTAGFDVCPLCQPLDGIVLSVKEARGMIPRHPNCRCAWIPANVGEPTKSQIWSADAVSVKIRQSLKKELPRVKDARQRRKLSRWLGAGAKLAAKTGLKARKGPSVFQTKARLDRVFVKTEYKLKDADFFIPKKGSQWELTSEGLAKVALAEGYTGPLSIPRLPTKGTIKVRHQVDWIKEQAAKEAAAAGLQTGVQATKAAHSLKTKIGMGRSNLVRKLAMPQPTEAELKRGRFTQKKINTHLAALFGRPLATVERVVVADASQAKHTFRDQWAAVKGLLAEEAKAVKRLARQE